jgi:hypothetical protein
MDHQISPTSIDAPTDIEPYLVCRMSDGEMQCSLWTLEDGRKTLPLFLSQDSATAYLQAAQLGDAWQVLRPAAQNLLQILHHCHESGVDLVSLDPDHEKARRLFDVRAILDRTQTA